MDLAERIIRDEKNARDAQEAAREKLGEPTYFKPTSDMANGIPTAQLALVDGALRRKATLKAIAEVPFDAMAEVEVAAGTRKSVLWYTNERSQTNEVLAGPDGAIHILAWTHPGIQLALSVPLNQSRELRHSQYALHSVRPLVRARYKRVIPSISGLYEPGGNVHELEELAPRAPRLKAVKLAMTGEQVEAFIARMDGFLLVSGAPGTGKTTVAFQRIRFLFDQQNLRDEAARFVEYGPEATRVFLANKNLIDYSRELLTRELGIPADVVSYVPTFIRDYVDQVWQHKHNARLRVRTISEAETRAREAFFNLCKLKDLRGVWETFELQVNSRLGKAPKADWVGFAKAFESKVGSAARRLAEALSGAQGRVSKDPAGSRIRMDALYARVKSDYESCRKVFSEKERRTFDARFARWLFWVYDPLDAIGSYFREQRYNGSLRIKAGTVELVKADDVIERVFQDWDGGSNHRLLAKSSGGKLARLGRVKPKDFHETPRRQYGPEEESWIAWILRFALPEENDSDDRFREIPLAIPDVNRRLGSRWTHVVIDEAQDLSVQEASLLASFVHAKGALTVSADFRQVVSPVHGMTDAEALKFGLVMWKQDAYMQYPFKKNMRQSREIGRFLVDFYQHTFQEFPAFDAGDRTEGVKPVLYTGDETLFAGLIKQMMAALSRSTKVKTVAVLQINRDLIEMQRLRSALESESVSLAPAGVLTPDAGQLVTTTVEDAKGLEFDVCIVLGLDDVERASLNFSKNRAYVGLSRPTRRLFILCEQYPPLLQKVQKDLFEHRVLR